MDRSETFTDFCPYVNGQHSIQVNFVDVATKTNPHQWKKGLANCEHSQKCSVRNSCPILAKIPVYLQS